jgi:hypothetical protein
MSFNNIFRGFKYNKFFHVFWLSTCWNIWLERNNILFNGKIANLSDIVDNIQRTSWIWVYFLGGTKYKPPFSTRSIVPLFIFKECNLTILRVWVPLVLTLIQISCLSKKKKNFFVKKKTFKIIYRLFESNKTREINSANTWIYRFKKKIIKSLTFTFI